MAERLIVPSWLHEPSGETTFDDPSTCYQHPDPLTGKPKVSNLASFRMADYTPRTSRPVGFKKRAVQIEIDLLVWGSSWTIYSSVPLQALPRLKDLSSLASMRDQQISIPGKVRLV